jgi:hypothetical protein
MAGEITSGTSDYVFSAEITGSSGYGELVLLPGGSVLIKIDLIPTGFIMTVDPYGEYGEPTVYVFTAS